MFDPFHREIWWFPKSWGYPKIINFCRLFPNKNHPFLGTLMTMETPISDSSQHNPPRLCSTGPWRWLWCSPGDTPLEYIQKTIENGDENSWFTHQKLMIFHSHVSLPESIHVKAWFSASNLSADVRSNQPRDRWFWNWVCPHVTILNEEYYDKPWVCWGIKLPDKSKREWVKNPLAWFSHHNPHTRPILFEVHKKQVIDFGNEQKYLPEIPHMPWKSWD